ncbi:probable serine/threonine-protein kinase At1g54610 isoform X2 [Durio zibethinus]|uniref:Probable serine/threonine-protein kinase At1g54610 isoform X2 n=1 Tax=Durio zibethinus TaxID=66656 RepID=A0A6P5ZER9_DURZI|nr:probable serine/threonine-protein kinase At1g54610 isoform X2 [Durio zibethinus]
MGCVQVKSTSTYSPSQRLQKLKQVHTYAQRGDEVQKLPREDSNRMLVRHEGEVKNVGMVNGAKGGVQQVITKEGEIVRNDCANGKFSQRHVSKKIGGDELIDGWPKWLVDNISTEVLVGLVPKSADSYDKLDKVGQGTYSNVYKARDRCTGKIVALKKVRFNTSEPKSVKFMAREITILQKLNHPNIISLEGLATSRMQYSLYLVFDFMQSDLTKVISRPGEKLTEPQIKCYMQQLLSGLQHCHERGILHRDIKGSNLLIDRNGVLKIADFGLANSFRPKPKRPVTSRVVTLWYRAPELLLGSTDYGVGIDLWSAGCLLAEMFAGRPIMPGRTEVEQLHRIFKLCGSPSEEYWKKLKLPASFRPPQHYKPGYQEAFGDFPDSSFRLLTMLLALDPSYRVTAASALQSEFFSSSPLACELSGQPVIYKEADEPYETKDRKTTSKTKQSSRRKHEYHGTKDLMTEQKKDDTDTSREKGHETCNSGRSGTSSSLKTIKHDKDLRAASLSPILRSNSKIAPRTEAHPNATQNIQNSTLLQGSIMKNNLGNPQHRRSFSTLDFRTLDPDKISKLFGVE